MPDLPDRELFEPDEIRATLARRDISSVYRNFGRAMSNGDVVSLDHSRVLQGDLPVLEC